MANLRLPLFPLGVVLFPSMPLPLHIFEEKYKMMIGTCVEQDAEFGVVYYAGNRLSEKGCTAKITKVLRRYEDGRMDILTVGHRRFIIQTQYDEEPYLEADVTYFEDQKETMVDQKEPLDDSFTDLVSEGIEKLNELALLAERQLDTEALTRLDLSVLSFIIAGNDEFTMPEKQRFLEMTSSRERLQKGIVSLDNLIERTQVSEEIKELIGGNGHSHDFLSKN